MQKALESWTVEQSKELYSIDHWGGDYFGVNPAGNISVTPQPGVGADIDLYEVVQEARNRGLPFPLLVRFQDLLRNQVKRINECFCTAITDLNYQGNYRGVFPIKVNQLREVVEEITDAGKEYNYGLEVGSKPELFAALAIHEDPELSLIHI